jgi:hypothetical protein
MGYDKISGLRDLFERDTYGYLNPPQRLILFVMVSFEGADGFFLDFERFRSMTGLKTRALMQNLHYLRDGKSYKKGLYLPCPNHEHKHLGIISTERYARTGAKQTYRIDLSVYEGLISVHGNALTNNTIENNSVHGETGSAHLEVKLGAPTSQSGSTTVHPYIQDLQDIQDIQALEGYGTKLKSFLDMKLPNEKRFRLTLDLLQLCTQLEHKGTSFKAIEREISPVGEKSITNPKAFVRSRLMDLMEREPDWSPDNKPKWCGSCEEISRQNKYPSEIPGGDGAMTYSCLNCDPFMVSRRNL